MMKLSIRDYNRFRESVENGTFIGIDDVQTLLNEIDWLRKERSRLIGALCDIAELSELSVGNGGYSVVMNLCGDIAARAIAPDTSESESKQ